MGQERGCGYCIPSSQGQQMDGRTAAGRHDTEVVLGHGTGEKGSESGGGLHLGG